MRPACRTTVRISPPSDRRSGECTADVEAASDHVTAPPSTRATSLPAPGDGTAPPRAHHRLVRGTVGMPPQLGHPREPNKSRRSIPAGLTDGLRAVLCIDPVGMNLGNGGVHRHRLLLDPNGRLLPEMFERPIGNPVPQPMTHPGVAGMPTAEPGWQFLHLQPCSATCGTASGTCRFETRILPQYRDKQCNVPVLIFGQFHP